MKRTIVLLVLAIPFLLHAQPRIKNKKYQGLLWEISGHGLKKSSYLFGTMHVSSKMAFHLADSFYIGIRNADVVALETNPESWQEDMSRYDLGEDRYGGRHSAGPPDDYFTIGDLRFYKYAEKIQRAMSGEPSAINNLLYRTYGNESSDFEEDTYLDMYIYQCGKRWGKQVAGVERYAESMRLMSEAYRDMANEKQHKTRNLDGDDDYSSAKLQEAYRMGNLDWLDTINKANSMSDAFDEKFLYKRNEIQALSIDSILRSGRSLFVGVGAAHLPGQRGVIEMLRAMGYTLRPVTMGARDSEHKTEVEKLRVPVVFNTETAADGAYTVQVPGHFYQFGEDMNSPTRQYADMANGSYYMVSRVMTNAWMWNQSPVRVRAVIDSLLYENIPGKIVKKSNITRNGYDGIDLVNRTRRGDLQRYNIFVTPFEVLIFKMSGTGDYVTGGNEADRFFNSIVLKTYHPGAPDQPMNGTPAQPTTGAQAPGLTGWKSYSPPSGGFQVSLPHQPYIGNDGSMIYDAADSRTLSNFRIIRTDVHNYGFVGEDSFDLAMMEESFGSSDFISKKIRSVDNKLQGYPCRDVTYSDRNGGSYVVRFVIQGPHYYSVVAHASGAGGQADAFIASFRLVPFHYEAVKEQRDTSLYYTATYPLFHHAEKARLDLPGSSYNQEDDEASAGAAYQNKLISGDSTGEKIFLSYYRWSVYDRLKDSSNLDVLRESKWLKDSAMVVRSQQIVYGENGNRTVDAVVGQRNSSRQIRFRFIFRDGNGFILMNEGDTLTAPSSFVSNFFGSFKPFDTLRVMDVFSSKSDQFLRDFTSSDSVLHKRAVKALRRLRFKDDADLPLLKVAITRTTWNEPDYLDVKQQLISRVSDIRTKEATNYLQQLYTQATDTLDLQHAVLSSMLNQQTEFAFRAFRDIMVNEPPVLALDADDDYSPRLSSFMDGLEDSLRLTATIFPDLLPLMSLEDYRPGMLGLLASLVDSGLVKPKAYKEYLDLLQLTARQMVKKQTIAEKQRRIAKAEKEAAGNSNDYEGYQFNRYNTGQNEVSDYITVLLPFYDSREAVRTLIRQVFQGQDEELKLETMLQLLRHNKQYPDTLLNFFASKDLYRYRLYEELDEQGKGRLFPAAWASQQQLIRSEMLATKSYEKIDSLVYLDRYPITLQGRTGTIWFFKYRKKDDTRWKIATSGMVPDDSTRIHFGDDDGDESRDDDSVADDYRYRSGSDAVTGFSETKLNEDKPLQEQLQKILKRISFYSQESGRQFYNRRDANEDDDDDENADEVGGDIISAPKVVITGAQR